MTQKDKISELSPGILLKKAREAKGWSQDEVAKQLRLSVKWIDDIESDNYSQGAAVIYIRGYLRSYARLMDVSTDLVIDGLEALGLQEDFSRMKSKQEKITLQPTVPVFTENSKLISGRAIRWISGFMLVILVILVALWWQGQRKHSAVPIQPKVNMQTQEVSVQPQNGSNIKSPDKKNTKHNK